MRTEAFLSFVVVAMAFISGALVLSVKNNPSLGLSIPELQQEVQRFSVSEKPVSSLRIEGISDFIDPQNVYPFYFKFDYQEVQALMKFTQDCKQRIEVKKSIGLKKTWEWEEAKCKNKKLAPSFYESPPYFHPSGRSFAILAQNDSAWNLDHLKLFHAFEINDLKISNLPAPYSYLANLDIDALSGLSAGESLVITQSYIFLDRLQEGRYIIFSRKNWNQYWEQTPFKAHSLKENENCFSKEGSVCWTYDFKKAIFPKWHPLLILVALSLLLTVFVFILLAVRIRQRQTDQKRLKFTLEMLAHEIRTPTANLALTVEKFRNQFNGFPDLVKSDLLRLFDQVERLKRVAETSSNYLQKNIGKSLIETQFTEVKSLSDFINHTLDAYLSQIDLKIESDQTSVILDPYWTSICIKNIVENSILHGAGPVEVSVIQNGKRWSVEVSDQGNTDFNPEIKGPKSSGFGLGYKIVKNILPHLNATMTLTLSPTRFKIFFGDKV